LPSATQKPTSIYLIKRAMSVEKLSSNASWGGVIQKFKAKSEALGGLDTQFNVFVPSADGASSSTFPVLYYLAGLTCTEDTGAQKGGFLRDAASHGIALVFPDTSPRGARVAGEDDGWDFGTGAGFYLNASNSKWSKHYNMDKFVTEELPTLLGKTGLPLDTKTASIFGHSMGGHGAISLYLLHPELYKSASGFAPILNPTQCPWGKKAFSGPSGNDGYLEGGVEEGKGRDSTELIKKAKGRKVAILVDTGLGDNFHKDGQLLPDNFIKAAKSAGFSEADVSVRKREDYDHSYWFIQTFGPEHIQFHAKHLLGK